jgi:hypothetical protein
MRPIGRLIALALALAVCGCASQEKEWMKPDQRYTDAEFRRDYGACSRTGTLDETCLRAKGWVSVSPNKPDKPVEVQRPPGPPSGIGPATRQ